MNVCTFVKFLRDVVLITSIRALISKSGMDGNIRHIVIDRDECAIGAADGTASIATNGGLSNDVKRM